MFPRPSILLYWLVAASSSCATLAARDWIVAPSGGDFTTVQAALDVAQAGERVFVRTKVGGYREALVFRRGGNTTQGPLVLASYPGERAAIDGTGLNAEVLITIHDLSFIEVRDLEIANLSQVTDGSGIRISGDCEGVRLIGNEIHSIRGTNAMGITVYGTSTTGSICDLLIERNWIHDCEPAPSEALVLNGNVERFLVAFNLVEDVNNIGIDFIGGESSIHPTQVARNGVCRANVVRRARSTYGGGYGAGIYVDGGRDLWIEHNWVEECDLGIEIGAENRGFDATNIVVRGNTVVRNDKAGLVCGGYNRRVGRVRDVLFESNTTYHNDTLATGNGEVWAQFTDGIHYRNNIFHAGPQGLLLASRTQSLNLHFDWNLWFSASANTFWNYGGQQHSSFAAFQAAALVGAGERFGDPLFTAPHQANFALLTHSPAIDAGDPFAAATGLDSAGFPRQSDGDLDGYAQIDRGAFEACNGRLEVLGDLLPNTVLQVHIEGQSNLFAVLLAGAPTLPIPLSNYGLLQLDPHQAFFAFPLGVAPASISLPIPPELQPGATLGLQGVVLLGNVGNLTNAWLR